MLTLFILSVLGAGLAFGTMYIAAGLLALLWYVLLAIGRWRMFEKMDRPGWKGFIPIYADYVLYDACWQTTFFWISLVAAIICGGADEGGRSLIVSLAGLIGTVFDGILSLRLSRSFGHGVPFAIGLILLNPLFVLYLGFGPDRYYRLA